MLPAHMQQPELSHPRFEPAVYEGESEKLITVIRSQERRSGLGNRTPVLDEVSDAVFAGPLPVPGRDVEFDSPGYQFVAFHRVQQVDVLRTIDLTDEIDVP